MNIAKLTSTVLIISVQCLISGFQGFGSHSFLVLPFIATQFVLQTQATSTLHYCYSRWLSHGTGSSKILGYPAVPSPVGYHRISLGILTSFHVVRHQLLFMISSTVGLLLQISLLFTRLLRRRQKSQILSTAQPGLCFYLFSLKILHQPLPPP